MLGQFSCQRYRFRLRACSPIRLSSFAGATLRGGMGHLFKRLVCVWAPGDCDRCDLRYSCSYAYVFETRVPPDAAKLRGVDQIPRPYVIEPPALDGKSREIVPGAPFDFGLVLIGRGIDFLPNFLFTFTELGHTGLGGGRGKYEVVELFSEGDGRSAEPVSLFDTGVGRLAAAGGRLTGHDLTVGVPADNSLTLEFLTPTRITTSERVQREPTFQDLVRALLRRLSSLCYFHCGSELDVDFKGLIDGAATIRTADSKLTWQQQSRFSGRQKQRIAMGGVVGSITFAAPDEETWKPYLPLLAAGQFVHVGKGAVMGLGKYQMT